jgi:hypothetical protein
VADIDGKLLTAEIGLLLALAAQVVVAVVGVGAAYPLARWGGRPQRWAGFALLVALAAVASGWTLGQCREARAEVRGRMEGRVAGPHMSSDRAENALAGVAWYGVISVGVAAATVGGGWGLGRLGRRHHRAGDAEPGAAPDPAI